MLNGLSEIDAPATDLSSSPGSRIPADFGAGNIKSRRLQPPPERHIASDPLGSKLRRLAIPVARAVTKGFPFGYLSSAQ